MSFQDCRQISESLESKLQQLIPTATNKQQEIQSRRRQPLVLRFAAGAQLARANDTQDDNTSWSRSLFNQTLSACHNYHCIEFFFCGGSTYCSSHWPQNCGEHKPYCDRPTFQQFRRMSHMLASFVDEKTASSSNATANPSSSSAFAPALPASLAPPATAQVPAVSSTANLAIGVNDGNQLLCGLIPGGTFTNCQFTFNLNLGPQAMSKL